MQTLRYGEGPEQVAEYYPAADPAALVVFLHGGYWRERYDRTHARPLASALADAGFAVLLPEYRRVGQPGGGWPGTLVDVAAAIDALPAAVAGELAAAGRAPVPLLLAGHSAGGHLALWAAARHHLPPGAPGAPGATDGASSASGTQAPIAGVLALAPVADLALASRLRLGDGATDDFLGGPPEAVPERYAVADPAALAPPGVPVTVLHGEVDDVVAVDVVRSYAADGRADVRMLPGAEHFGVITPGSAEWPHVLDALARLIPAP